MRFRVLEHVVDGPEGETERVVVDVQVDEVVALDVRVGLSVQAHVVDGVLYVVARVVGGQQLVGRRLSQEPNERLHRRREALLRHAEPQVVEVLVEHLEVLVDLLRTERARANNVTNVHPGVGRGREVWEGRSWGYLWRHCLRRREGSRPPRRGRRGPTGSGDIISLGPL